MCNSGWLKILFYEARDAVCALAPFARARCALACFAAACCAIAVQNLACAFEDAQVLPVGRMRTSFVYGRARSIDQNYNALGQTELLTEPYRFELSSSALRKLTPELDRLVKALNATGYHYNQSERTSPSHGFTLSQSDPLVGDALTRGFLDLRATAERDHFALSSFYGVTSWLSIGVGLQWVNNRVKVSKAITGTNTASDIIKGFEATDPTVLGDLKQLPQAVKILSDVDEETLQSILQSRGYARLEDTQQKNFGDTIVGARVLGYQSPSSEFLTSSQFTLGIPTGELKGHRDLARVDLGTGAWEIGAAQTVNYKPHWLSQRFALSLSGGGSYSIPYTRELRVPNDVNDVLPSSDRAQNVRVRLGAKLQTAVGARVSLTSWCNLSTAWELQGILPDRYGASILNPPQTRDSIFQKSLSLLKFNLSLSSVSSFLRHEFALPGDFSVMWVQPLAGKNQAVSPHLILESALYF